MSDAGSTYWALVEPYWALVDIYNGEEAFRRTFAAVPRSSASLLAAHWCQSEVCNGGFHQFFTNVTGVLAPEALEAFVEIGRADLAELLRSAMAFFGEPYPRDQEVRTADLRDGEDEEDQQWDPFVETDDSFYDRLKDIPFERSADLYATSVAGQ